MPKFQRVRQNPPRSAKFRGMVHCVCCANSTDNPKFARVSKGIRKGSKKAHSVGSGGSRGFGTSSPPNKIDARILSQGPESQPSRSKTQRCNSSGPAGCSDGGHRVWANIPAPAGTRSEGSIPNSATHSATSRLREWARNGGRSFSRTLGSFQSYSRRTLRTIRMRWSHFKVTNIPAATRYAKYGCRGSVGSRFRWDPLCRSRWNFTAPSTPSTILTRRSWTRIENVTAQLDRLHEESLAKEFAAYPDQTIFDLYNAPLRRDSHGTYHLGIEDIPRNEGTSGQNGTSLSKRSLDYLQRIKGIRNRTIEAKTARMFDINRTSHLARGMCHPQRHRKSSAGKPSGEGVHLAQFLGV